MQYNDAFDVLMYVYEVEKSFAAHIIPIRGHIVDIIQNGRPKKWGTKTIYPYIFVYI